MDWLTSLLIVFGAAFAICLGLLVKMVGDPSQASVLESPAILATPSKSASVEEPGGKGTASHESSPTEWSGAL